MALRISKAGLETMQKQLESLREELGKLRVFKGSIAIHSGDAWHDNNDFEQCEIDERRLQRQISDLEADIENAIIIDDTATNSNVVNYGAHVTVQLIFGDDDFEEDTILFSDSDEPSNFMKVSANSPLGNAIFNKEVGYTGSYNVDNNIFKVKILKIEY